MWRRIDANSLLEYLDENDVAASGRDEDIASILRRAGGRIRFISARPHVHRWLWHTRGAVRRLARRPDPIPVGSGTTIYEVRIAFFLNEFDEVPSAPTLWARISSRWEERPRGIRLSFPPELRAFRWLDVGLVGALVATFILFLTGPFSSSSYCGKHSVWCGAAGSVVAATTLGVVGLLLFFTHAHRAIRRYLLDARESQPRPPAGRQGRISPQADVLDTEGPRAEVRDVLTALGVVSLPRRVARALSRLAGSRWQPPAPVRLIVGPPGAGKTTLLQALGRQLARAGFVPVVIDPTELRKGDQLAALARQGVKEWLDSSTISQKESERVLQWIAQSGKLVILADDLHRLAELGHPELARVVLNATRQRCAVVATARRGAVPVGLEQWVVDIEELQPMTIGEATKTVLGLAAAQWQRMSDEGLAPRWPNAPRKPLEGLIAAGELHKSRFFTAHVLPLLICADARSRLAALRASSAPIGGELRARLLDAYVDAFLNGELRPQRTSPKRTPDEIRAAKKRNDERRSLLGNLELACLAALIEQKDVTVDRTMSGVDQAVQAGLLRPVNGQFATVEHALLQSYLASRALLSHDTVPELIRLAGSAEADDALLFYAGRRNRQAEARITGERLYGEADAPANKRQCMRIAIAAADVAQRAQIDARPSLAAIQKCWPSAGPLEKCDAVERVAQMGTRDAIRFLWANSQDADYRVRWAVARGITDNPFPGERLYAALGDNISEAFTAAERLVEKDGDVDDWEPEVLRLKTLAWTLPALELSTQDLPEQEKLADDIDRLLWLLDGREHGRYPQTTGFHGITNQLGFEASVAQGFRAAARLAVRPKLADHPLDGSWSVTLRRLHNRLEAFQPTTRFWYSKLLLLHGVAELEIAGEAREWSEDRWSQGARISAWARADHAFLRRAAHLCDRAVEEARKLARETTRRSSPPGRDGRAALLERLWGVCDEYIWDDEGVAVRALSTKLRPAALLLLGEVTTLLNLNEKGSVSRRLHLARRSDLPLCLSGGPKEQWRMLGEDWRGRPFSCPGPPECEFNLCPYHDQIAREPNAVRPLSRAFCLQLQRSAMSMAGARVRGAAIRGQFWGQVADRFSS
jgi:hypothetical protein